VFCQPHDSHQEQNMCGYLGKDTPQLPWRIQYYISQGQAAM